MPCFKLAGVYWVYPESRWGGAFTTCDPWICEFGGLWDRYSWGAIPSQGESPFSISPNQVSWACQRTLRCNPTRVTNVSQCQELTVNASPVNPNSCRTYLWFRILVDLSLANSFLVCAFHTCRPQTIVLKQLCMTFDWFPDPDRQVTK